MPATVTKLQVKNALLENAVVGGNSEYTEVQACSDLLNNYGRGKGKMGALVDGTFLSYTTLDRMMTLAETELGDPYNPQSETIRRILSFFGYQMTLTSVHIKPKFQNKPKA